jgi:uncharacterized protein (TIGR00251 family)
MEKLPAWARHDRGVWMLEVHVQPGARVSAIVGDHGGRLKIKISAPPADNAANEALMEFIARVAAVPKSRVRLVRGQSSRLKTLAVERPTLGFLDLLTTRKDSPAP